jgi:hypothetical protein
LWPELCVKKKEGLTISDEEVVKEGKCNCRTSRKGFEKEFDEEMR